MAAILVANLGHTTSLSASARHQLPAQLRHYCRRSHMVMMPEGPECKSLAESLDLELGSARYILQDVSLDSGRYKHGTPPKDIGKLRALLATPTTPQTLQHVRSKGKFIYFSLSDCTLWSTLGLTGGWTHNPSRSHVRLSLEFRPLETDHPSRRLYFYDMRNFGTFRVSLDRTELAAKLETLGHDWLDPASRPSVEQFLALAHKAARFKRPLAVFLMDQKKTSGIGNYVLSEVLYKCAIHPMSNCADVSAEGWRDIYSAVTDTLQESYAAQSPLVSMSSYRDFKFQVYAQKTSPAGTAVVKVLGPHKRSIHYCPLKQIRFEPEAGAEAKAGAE